MFLIIKTDLTFKILKQKMINRWNINPLPSSVKHREQINVKDFLKHFKSSNYIVKLYSQYTVQCTQSTVFLLCCGRIKSYQQNILLKEIGRGVWFFEKNLTSEINIFFKKFCLIFFKVKLGVNICLKYLTNWEKKIKNWTSKGNFFY